MSRLLFPSSILLIAAAVTLAHTTVLAEIFKEVDKDGNIVYTDVPRKGKQEPVSVKPMSTFKSRAVTSPASSTKAKKPAKKKTTTTYSALQISSPGADAVIRANSGVISITLHSQPGLDAAAGHQFVVLLDGTQRQTSQSASVSISEVDRGSHSIGAEIRDKNDRVLVSASPVQVNILRASILRPRNR